MATSKNSNAHLWRRPDAPGGWWYYRRILFGVPRAIALEVQDLTVARQLRDEFDAVYLAERTHRRLGLPSSPAALATLQRLRIYRSEKPKFSTSLDLYSAWFSHWAATKQRPQTGRDAWTGLLLILRRGGVDLFDTWPATEEREAVPRFDLEAVNTLTLAHYEAACLTRARTPLAIDRARHTLASTIGHARAIFSDKARASAHYAGLSLPPCIDEFMSRAVDKGKAPSKPAITVAAMQRFQRGRVLMRRFAPRHWLASILARELGLRRNEVVHARWDWFKEVASQVNSGRRWWECHVVVTDEYGPKGNARKFRLEAEDLAAWLEIAPWQGRLSPAPTILPGTLEEREEVLEELCQWLRDIELVTDLKVKPLHLLRAMRATELIETRTLGDAQRQLGHDSSRTTRRHYELPAQAVR